MEDKPIIKSQFGIVAALYPIIMISCFLYVSSFFIPKIHDTNGIILYGLSLIAVFAISIYSILIQRIIIYEKYFCSLTNEKIFYHNVMSVNESYNIFPIDSIYINIKGQNKLIVLKRMRNSNELISQLLNLIFENNNDVYISKPLVKKYLGEDLILKQMPNEANIQK